MMNYHFTVRNHRSKGLTVGESFQILMFFVVGVWLIYQIKNSHSNTQETTRSRLKVELGSNILGRKGTGRWSDDFSYFELSLKDANLMAVTEKKEGKDSHVYEDSNIAIQLEEEDEVASRNGMLKEDFIEKEMESSEGVLGNIKDPQMNKDNVTGNLLKDSKRAEMEKGKSDFLLKHGGLDNTPTSVEEKDEKDGSHSFHDENGVPQGPNDESTQDESTELEIESRMVESLPIEELKRSETSKSDSDSDM